MRLEVEMHGAKLPPIWDGTALDSALAYRKFRDYVLLLVPRPVARPTNLVQFFATLEAEGCRPFGRPAHELYAIHHCSRRRAKLAADVRAQVVTPWLLDLRDRYPESGEWPALLDAGERSEPGAEVA
jgi:hypothetical protein